MPAAVLFETVRHDFLGRGRVLAYNLCQVGLTGLLLVLLVVLVARDLYRLSRAKSASTANARASMRVNAVVSGDLSAYESVSQRLEVARDFRQFDVADVAYWSDTLGLSRSYAAALRAAGVDGRALAVHSGPVVVPDGAIHVDPDGEHTATVLANTFRAGAYDLTIEVEGQRLVLPGRDRAYDDPAIRVRIDATSVIPLRVDEV